MSSQQANFTTSKNVVMNFLHRGFILSFSENIEFNLENVHFCLEDLFIYYLLITAH